MYFSGIILDLDIYKIIVKKGPNNRQNWVEFKAFVCGLDIIANNW